MLIQYKVLYRWKQYNHYIDFMAYFWTDNKFLTLKDKETDNIYSNNV